MKGFLARLKQINEQEIDQSSDPVNGNPTKPGKLLVDNFLERGQPIQNGLPRETPPTSARSDDTFAIKMVTNCNTDTQKQEIRSPRSKLSKELSFSITTLDNDKDEPELMALGSDDDDEMETPKSAMQPGKAWAMFEESMRHIDDSKEVFIKKPKPNFTSSDSFKSVMIDMYGEVEYGTKKRNTRLKDKFSGLSRMTGLATRAIMKTSARNKDEENENVEENMDLKSEQNGEVEEDQPDASSLLARRGWKMLKRQVNETMMENNTATSKLQWATLRQTLKGMTNTDRTRRDLYERYGIIPTVRPDGTVVQENTMLSERARAEMAKKPNPVMQLAKRPASYHHPVSYSRTGSGSSQTSFAGNAKLPQIHKTKPKQKQRPRTSKR